MNLKPYEANIQPLNTAYEVDIQTLNVCVATLETVKRKKLENLYYKKDYHAGFQDACNVIFAVLSDAIAEESESLDDVAMEELYIRESPAYDPEQPETACT